LNRRVVGDKGGTFPSFATTGKKHEGDPDQFNKRGTGELAETLIVGRGETAGRTMKGGKLLRK